MFLFDYYLIVFFQMWLSILDITWSEHFVHVFCIESLLTWESINVYLLTLSTIIIKYSKVDEEMNYRW
jgi:hypothetical protein